MEKREPSLAPEWLRRPRHNSNQLLSSSSRSDSASWLNHDKKKISRRTSDVNSVRSRFLNERSSSTNTWRGSSYNGFTKNTYSRGHDEQLRRSYSMTTSKHGKHLAQDGGNINFDNMKGILPLSISRRGGFEKGFPLFRGKESNGGPSVVRISSPGPCLAAQSLPVGKSTLFTGEGWTSALAEVPNIIKKTSVTSHDNGGNSPILMGRTARNMAQALVQTPSMGEVNTKRLEDKAIKQSRQLRPFVPKGSAKPMVRSGETDLASSRNTMQQSSMVLGNLGSNPGCPIKPATIKKPVVLKPTREDGVSAIKTTGPSQLPTAPSTQVTTCMTKELKGVGRIVEKKSFLGQSQSRNAFYKALKKSSSTNISSSSTILSIVEEKTNTLKDLPPSDSSYKHSTKRDEIMERIEKIYQDKTLSNGFISVARPCEIEVRYLRYLGWNENNSEEDQPLTYEEVRSFIEQYKRCKLPSVQKLPIQEATKDITAL